jgi:hypothetical protein
MNICLLDPLVEHQTCTKVPQYMQTSSRLLTTHQSGRLCHAGSCCMSTCVQHTPKLLLQDMMCDAAGRVSVNLHRRWHPVTTQAVRNNKHQLLCCYSSSSCCVSTFELHTTVPHSARYDLLCCKTGLCCQYCPAECDDCACLCASCEKQQPSCTRSVGEPPTQCNRRLVLPR